MNNLLRSTGCQKNNNAIANIQDYKLSRRKGAFKNKIFLKDVEED